MNYFLRKNFKYISAYLLFSFISKLIPFLALPILTHLLSLEDYGKWTLFLAVLLFTNPCIGLMQRSQIARKFYKVKSDHLAEIAFNILAVTLINSLIFFTIFATLSLFLNHEVMTIHNILILSAVGLLRSIIDVALTIYRFRNKVFSYGIVELSSQLFTYLIGFLLIFTFSSEWYYLLYGLAITYFIVSLYCLKSLFTLRALKPVLSKKHIFESIKLSAPLVPHAIGSTIIATSDKFIIEGLMDLQAVAIYSIGYILGSSSLLIIDSVNKVWFPYMYKQLNQVTDESKKMLVKTSYFFFFGLPFICATFAIMGDVYLTLFFPKEYLSAKPIIYWTAFAVMFRGFYVILFPYVDHIGKTVIFMYSTVLSALVNILLTYLFVDLFGLVGAVFATAVSFFIQFIIILFYSNRYFKLPWLKVLK